MEMKIIALVLLGPLSALYDLCTNPAAPPQIFVAQYEESFGHPPGANIPTPTAIKFHKPVKHVYVSHG